MPLPRIHPLLACIFFAWQPTGTGWCQAPPPLQLLPQVAVDGTGVFMSQLVVGGGTNTAWHVRLCDAPAPGRSLVLPMHQVRSLVDKHLPAASTPFWAGPQVVQITRRMRTLQAQELLSALTARLREISLLSEGELDVRFARPWTPAPIADEPFELRLHPLPASGITPITQVKADLLAGDESIASWLLPVEIRLWKPAWVCRKALKKGQTLTSDDVELERRDVLRSVSALHPESLD
ncbi:MAG: hypothetical protein FJ405_19565, partial [Verrucomicrobia bacterium]|nr:hypothetical protein [Verrucomicrobiota bacterium]